MFTTIFSIGYILSLFLLTATGFVHWVYTGELTMTSVEYLMSILIRRLFCKILIPCLLIDSVLFSGILDEIKQWKR